MRKETNEALNAVISDLVKLPGCEATDVSINAAVLTSVIINTEADLRDCVNELCLKCGNYREEHLGACNGCRWKEVKDGFYD